MQLRRRSAWGRALGAHLIRAGHPGSRRGPAARLAYTPAGMATTRDYYEILGLERSASDEEIKRSFRKLAQQWHPDVSTDADADARFKEINEAYQVLSDPQRRQSYDMFGRAGVGGTGAEGYGPFGGFQGFGDIFDAFFGGQAAGGTARRARRPAGADLRYDLTLTFDEAIHGAEKDLSFTALDRCATCDGSGAEAGSCAVRLPAVRRQRRGARGALHAAGPDGQRHRLRSLPGHRPDRGEALPGLSRRRAHGAQAHAARDRAGRHRRRPPDPPHRGRGGGAPGRHARQPLRRHARRGAPAPQARRHRAVPRAAPLDDPGGPRRPGAHRHAGRGGAAGHQARHPAGHGDPPPRQGRAAPAAPRRARRPPRARRRRRAHAPLRPAARAARAARCRERRDEPGRRLAAGGVPRTRKGKRSLGERIKDAIN